MKQPELNLFETALRGKPAVKKVQMRHFKMAHSVIVDIEQGTITELVGKEMAEHPAHRQLAVLHGNWLERVRYAMNQLNDLRERQSRERSHLEEMLREIMDESKTLNDTDLPKRVAAAALVAHHLAEDEILPPDWAAEDDNDPPF